MNRKRLWAGLGLLAVAGAITWLVVGSLQDNLVYFLTPTELQARGESVYDTPIRLGGQVAPGTVDWDAETRRLTFVLTDGGDSVRVESTGAPPAMFREGNGVVVEGRYRKEGVFHSTNLMVKHSNEYAPPEDAQHPKRVYESLMTGEEGAGEEGAAPSPDAADPPGRSPERD